MGTKIDEAWFEKIKASLTEKSRFLDILADCKEQAIELQEIVATVVNARKAAAVVAKQAADEEAATAKQAADKAAATAKQAADEAAATAKQVADEAAATAKQVADEAAATAKQVADEEAKRQQETKIAVAPAKQAAAAAKKAANHVTMSSPSGFFKGVFRQNAIKPIQSPIQSPQPLSPSPSSASSDETIIASGKFPGGKSSNFKPKRQPRPRA